MSGILKLEADVEELIATSEVQIQKKYPLKFFFEPKFALDKYLNVGRG
jgi:hypothetical protein